MKLKNIDVGNCLTVGELYYSIMGDVERFERADIPVVLKCGGRNHTLSCIKLIGGKLVLIGRK
jgi:hypothetical protein